MHPDITAESKELGYEQRKVRGPRWMKLHKSWQRNPKEIMHHGLLQSDQAHTSTFYRQQLMRLGNPLILIMTMSAYTHIFNNAAKIDIS